MKDKNVAGILALFFGWLGIHRFYLGQIGWGIFYLIFFMVSWIFGLIDAIAFFAMDEDEFNRKYNRTAFADGMDRYPRYEERRHRREERRRPTRTERRPATRRDRPARPRPATNTEYKRPRPRRDNPFKSSGVQKFKDYDYEGAIRDFEKALEIAPKDVALHFNLACAHSLVEHADKAFFHLDKAVDYGFDDFQRIKEHDALAFLRIQPQFDQFEANGFRMAPQLEAPKEDLLSSANVDLLDQLKRLGELRDKGLLTEEEFVAQKKKLLG